MVAVGVGEENCGQGAAIDRAVERFEMGCILGAGIDHSHLVFANEKTVGAGEGVGRGIWRGDARKAWGQRDGGTDLGAKGGIEGEGRKRSHCANKNDRLEHVDRTRRAQQRNRVFCKKGMKWPSL